MFKLFFIVSLLIGTSSAANIQIQTAQNQVSASEQISYIFRLLDDKTSKNITDKDLVETHTKNLHLIIFDASLNQFNHVHPQFDGSAWTVDLNLLVNGTYKVWAQGKTWNGKEFSVSSSLLVEGGENEIPVKSLGDVRKASDGTTQVELDSTRLKAGKMVMIDFKVSRTDGTIPNLSPYLGAFAHVIATQLNGNDLIHVHPMEGKNENTGMLHATFPLAGEYRLWIQLEDDGILKTIPLSVVVN